MSESITYEEWKDALSQLQLADQGPPKNGGWKTAMELAKEWDRSERTVRRIVSGLVQAGLWESSEFRAYSKDRRLLPAMYYRPLPKKKKST